MTPIPPPPTPPPLRLPDRALPPYRYIPGLNPHPFRHPDGHLYTDGGVPAEAPWDAAAAWTDDLEYLRGMDLFDHRFYWEAHEAWEAIWHQVDREAPYAVLLQGLIQAGAFALKHHMGHDRGAARLLAASAGRLMSVSESRGPLWRGLDLPETASRLRAFAAGGDWPLLANAPRRHPRDRTVTN